MERWARFAEKMPASTRSKAVWLRRIPARAAILIMAAWASFGCDSGSFVPPVNPELRGDVGAPPVGVTDASRAPTVSEIAPEPARPIEVVLSHHEPNEAEGWKTSARTQAGLDKAKLKISVLEADSPESKQAELVREALTHHPRVLVVEPADPADPGLVQAIEGAQGQGIPVVLVGRPLAAAKPALASGDAVAAKSSASHERQAPLVVIEPKFAESAKQVVAATIRVTKVSDVDPGGGAVLVINTVSDPFSALRELAIKDALKAAGITTIEEVRFASDSKAGEKLLKDCLKAHPKISMVFGVDPASAMAAREVVSAQDADRLVIAGCYTSEDQISNVSRMPHFAAVAEFTPTRVLRKGISTAVALAQGKELPQVVDFRISVSESPINSGVLKAQFLNQPKSSLPKENHPH